MGQLMSSEHGEHPLALTDDNHQYLTFSVKQERFALSILEVKEIIEVNQITRVPMAADFIKGVINLRGNVVPVIDFSARIGHKPVIMTKRSCIIFVDLDLEDHQHTMGMLVDEVKEIIEIPPQQLQPAPDFGADVRTDFIQAIGRVGDEFIVLISVKAVLSIDEISRLMSADHSSAQNHART